MADDAEGGGPIQPDPTEPELNNLQQMFPGVSVAQITQQYKANSGDMGETVNALLTVVAVADSEPNGLPASPPAAAAVPSITPNANDVKLQKSPRKLHVMFHSLLSHQLCEANRDLVHVCQALLRNHMPAQDFAAFLTEAHPDAIQLLNDRNFKAELRSLRAADADRIVRALADQLQRGQLPPLPHVMLPVAASQQQQQQPADSGETSGAKRTHNGDGGVDPKMARPPPNSGCMTVNDGEDDSHESSEAGPSHVAEHPKLPSGFEHVGVERWSALTDDQRSASQTCWQMFPDAEPSYIVDQLLSGTRLETLVDEMTAGRYPKLSARLERTRLQKRRDELLDPAKLDVDAFLAVFEDPDAYFNDYAGRQVSQLYVRHARIYLYNQFPHFQMRFLDRLLEHFNNHILPTYNHLTAGPRAKGRARRRIAVPPGMDAKLPQFVGAHRDRTEPMAYPDDVDETFFRELQYLEFGDRINDAQTARRERRAVRMAEARADGVLLECGCCFDDECLPEEMAGCARQHNYCVTCVRTHANTQIADGGYAIKCIDDECNEVYPVQVLRALLRPNVVDMMLRRMQQAELRSAELANMESCPFCDFALIIENEQEKVFRCHNPDCLKESCRQCREANHIPLKCDEVEKDVEVRIRTFIEEEMANALIRKCPKCHTQIIKQDGCNKMTCQCGCKFCYVCRQAVTGYEHFKENNGNGGSCTLHTQIDAVHADAALKAGVAAKEKFLADNPDAAAILARVEQARGADGGSGGAPKIESLVDRHPPPPGVRGGGGPAVRPPVQPIANANRFVHRQPNNNVRPPGVPPPPPLRAAARFADPTPAVYVQPYYDGQQYYWAHGYVAEYVQDYRPQPAPYLVNNYINVVDNAGIPYNYYGTTYNDNNNLNNNNHNVPNNNNHNIPNNNNHNIPNNNNHNIPNNNSHNVPNKNNHNIPNNNNHNVPNNNNIPNNNNNNMNNNNNNVPNNNNHNVPNNNNIPNNNNNNNNNVPNNNNNVPNNNHNVPNNNNIPNNNNNNNNNVPNNNNNVPNNNNNPAALFNAVTHPAMDTAEDLRAARAFADSLRLRQPPNRQRKNADVAGPSGMGSPTSTTAGEAGSSTAGSLNTEPNTPTKALPNTPTQAPPNAPTQPRHDILSGRPSQELSSNRSPTRRHSLVDLEDEAGPADLLQHRKMEHLKNTQDHLAKALQRLKDRLLLMKNNDADYSRLQKRVADIKSKQWMVSERLREQSEDDDPAEAAPPAATASTTTPQPWAAKFRHAPFSVEDLVARKLLIQGRISDMQREMRVLSADGDTDSDRDHNQEQRVQMTIRIKQLIEQQCTLDRQYRRALDTTASVVQRSYSECDGAGSSNVEQQQPTTTTDDSLLASLIVTCRDLRRSAQRLHEQVLNTQRKVCKGEADTGLLNYLFKSRDTIIKEQNAIEDRLLRSGMTEEQIEIVCSESTFNGDDMHAANSASDQLDQSQIKVRLLVTKMLKQLDTMTDYLEQNLQNLTAAFEEQETADNDRMHSLETQLQRVERERSALQLRIRHERSQRLTRRNEYQAKRQSLIDQVETRKRDLEKEKEALRSTLRRHDQDDQVNDAQQPGPSGLGNDQADQVQADKVQADKTLFDECREAGLGAAADQMLKDLLGRKRKASELAITDEDEPTVLFQANRKQRRTKSSSAALSIKSDEVQIIECSPSPVPVTAQPTNNNSNDNNNNNNNNSNSNNNNNSQTGSPPGEGAPAGGSPVAERPDELPEPEIAGNDGSPAAAAAVVKEENQADQPKPQWF